MKAIFKLNDFVYANVYGGGFGIVKSLKIGTYSNNKEGDNFYNVYTIEIQYDFDGNKCCKHNIITEEFNVEPAKKVISELINKIQNRIHKDEKFQNDCYPIGHYSLLIGNEQKCLGNYKLLKDVV